MYPTQGGERENAWYVQIGYRHAMGNFNPDKIKGIISYSIYPDMKIFFVGNSMACFSIIGMFKWIRQRYLSRLLLQCGQKEDTEARLNNG